MEISAVIPFCSYDAKFFKTCIDNLLACGIECIVVAYDHLHMGEKENEEILNECKSLYKGDPRFKFIQLEWHEGKSSLYWEAFARYMGMQKSAPDSTHILYIDIDEIVDKIKFKEWLDKETYKKYMGIKIRCYMYSMDAAYRLKGVHYNTIICKKWYAERLGLKIEARLQFFNNRNKISRWTAKLGINPFFYIYKKEPFIHHYTSVRTEENMIRKVTNWSHHADRSDWVELVKNTKIIGNKINGMEFEIVKNKFNL